MEFLSIISAPRYAIGSNLAIQRAAISSWMTLRPTPQLIILGKEAGIRELAQEYNALYVPDISYNVWGTPILSEVLHKGLASARGSLTAFISSDVQLGPSFSHALYPLMRLSSPFLLAGRTHDANSIVSPKPRYCLFPTSIAEDIFPQDRIPPLALGRPAAAEWPLVQALLKNIALIDGTAAISAFHPNHDSRHTRWGSKDRMTKGPEARLNLAYAGETTIADDWLTFATHQLSATLEIITHTTMADFQAVRDRVLAERQNASQILSQRFIDSALLAEKFGLIDQAFKMLDQAAAFSPNFPGIGVTRSLCLRKVGRFQEARATLERERSIPGLEQGIAQLLTIIDEEEAAALQSRTSII